MPKNKKINWSEIWAEIAEAYDTPDEHKTEKQKCLTFGGLCDAIDYFDIPNSYSLLNNFSVKPLFWWPLTKNGNKCRATFAGLMAAMGDDAFEELIGIDE